VSLVAEVNGEIVGHVAVSPITISDGSDGWFGLGPVSVAPEHQRRGVGQLLVRAALERLRERRAAGCVVFGHANYYPRFGFTRLPALVLPGLPQELFFAPHWRGAVPTGEVAYHAAFGVGPG
jgi:predicted N-acetyltransferase YhbS